MLRSRILSILALAILLFMGQMTLVPTEAEAVPFLLWAAGYYITTNSGTILAVAGTVGAGVAANFIYDAITGGDDCSCSSSCSSCGCSSCDSDSSSSESGSSSGGCSGSRPLGGYNPSDSYVH